MAVDNIPKTLIRLEAGLRAELDVLRFYAETDAGDDAKEELKFSLADAQLNELKLAKELLDEELLKAQFRVKQLTRHVRDLNTEDTASRKAADEEEELTEEALQKDLYALRRRALAFAKEQWPLSQDAELFEGGDFWDACVAACARSSTPIEYSDREAAFAELLLQAGIADRIEDLGGMKRIRLCEEIYKYDEDRST
jgi:hypothetical protein